MSWTSFSEWFLLVFESESGRLTRPTARSEPEGHRLALLEVTVRMLNVLESGADVWFRVKRERPSINPRALWARSQTGERVHECSRVKTSDIRHAPALGSSAPAKPFQEPGRAICGSQTASLVGSLPDGGSGSPLASLSGKLASQPAGERALGTSPSCLRLMPRLKPG